MNLSSGAGRHGAPDPLLHPSVSRVAGQFKAKELHAARSGRDVMQALAAVVRDSSASSMDSLAPELEMNMDALIAVMPAYAPPINVMHDVHSSFESARRSGQPLDLFRTSMAQAGDSYLEQSQQARMSIADSALQLLPKGGVVFTYTLSETVLAVLHRARDLGMALSVLVTESRPNGDGRTTASTVAGDQAHVEIGIDASIAELIPRADVMFVGAEAILSDGSAVCKVGTYPSALMAKRSGVPVYVLVDSRKFHAGSLRGQELPLDRIDPDDVLSEGTSRQAKVCGHLFDRTPPQLITAVITEHGSLAPVLVSQWMLRMPQSEFVAFRLRDRTAGVRGA